MMANRQAMTTFQTRGEDRMDETANPGEEDSAATAEGSVITIKSEMSGIAVARAFILTV